MDPTGRQERWQLAGTAAEVYQDHLVPSIFGAWAPIVVDAASVRPGDRVVDVACGTGIVAREAAGRLDGRGSVVGLDTNPGMLAVARSVAVASGSAVEWREADVMAMPFADGSFDVALCQLGLQYFPDRPAALGEMRRVLAPGGRVVLMVWQAIDHSPGFSLLAEALERHVGPAVATMMRAPFAFDDPAELETLVAGVGFRDINVSAATGVVRFDSVDDFVRYQVAGSPLAGPVGEASPHAREALARAVDAALRPFTSTAGVEFPIGAYLAAGRR